MRLTYSQDRADAIQGAEEVALTLAMHGEKGFEHLVNEPLFNRYVGTIRFQILRRLTLISDHEVVPREVRKRASHCGGVMPRAYLAAFEDTPLCADPGNQAYAVIVDRLIAECQQEVAVHADIQMRQQIDALQNFNWEHKGDVVEAALAAACYACNAQMRTEMTWEGLAGGTHAEGDLPT